MERERAEKERLENEARARVEAANQIKTRVQTTGLSVNVVDEQVPDFVLASPRSGLVRSRLPRPSPL